MTADSANSPLKAWVRALELTAPIARNPNVTLPVQLDDLAAAHGSALALIGEQTCLTYVELARMANRYARWAIGRGLGRGDVVALVMRNRPEYLAIWLGLTRVGAVVALINTNLVGDSLRHAIRIAGPKHVIAGDDLAPAVAAACTGLSPSPRTWTHGGDAACFERIDRAAERLSGERVPVEECVPPTIGDRALYIYTSGTTGLPKAANVSHRRVMQWSYWFAGLLDTQAPDRMYNCLPMYHSVGGIVAVGATLVRGGAVVVRERFSARTFWDDVVDQRCTLFQYIGELCRFLLNSPPHPREREHQLRVCCGNGLRPDVWEPFQQRFQIPRILEFYAATEANFSLYNCEGKPGAIGKIPPFLAHRFPVALVRFDVDAGDPIRGADGFCQRCAADEVGEAISKISQGEDAPEARFDGYTDRAASERKILRDVFKPGDAWFRSGDLMRRDAAGFFHFVDRIGDTFRWKGENVSTSEVAETLTACPGVTEAIVYGVEVPGADGRAGMAALVVDERFTLPELERHVAARLPEYARPVFVRLLEAIETTGTFKPKKQDLVRTGYDPQAIADALYWYDRTARTFTRLDEVAHARVQSGETRL